MFESRPIVINLNARMNQERFVKTLNRAEDIDHARPLSLKKP